MGEAPEEPTNNNSRKKKLGKLAKHTRKRAGGVASDKAQKKKTRRWSTKKRDKDERGRCKRRK
jgi:hypothetical protein